MRLGVTSKLFFAFLVTNVRSRGLGWNYRTGQRLERRRYHRRSADRLQRAATGHQHVTAAQERQRCPQSGVGIREDGKFMNIGHSISPRHAIVFDKHPFSACHCDESVG